MRAFGMLTATPTPDSEPRTAHSKWTVLQCLHPHPDMPARKAYIHQTIALLGIEAGVMLFTLWLFPQREAVSKHIRLSSRGVEDDLSDVKPNVPLPHHNRP